MKLAETTQGEGAVSCASIFRFPARQSSKNGNLLLG